jgi:hypothetical protein
MEGWDRVLTCVGGRGGGEEVGGGKNAGVKTNEVQIPHRSGGGHLPAVNKSMDDEEMIVDISDDEMEGQVVSSSSGRCGHETSAPFAEETPVDEVEARADSVQDRYDRLVDQGYGGDPSHATRQSSSTEEERVEDLVYESDEEPPAERTKVVKRRCFGGR